VARKIAEWVDRLGAVWVEGQLAQVTARAGTGTAFLVLRDPAADVSLQLTAPIGLVRDGGGRSSRATGWSCTASPRSSWAAAR
jgi:exodeoxyribonuclease VII large subunit